MCLFDFLPQVALHSALCFAAPLDHREVLELYVRAQDDSPPDSVVGGAWRPEFESRPWLLLCCLEQVT